MSEIHWRGHGKLTEELGELLQLLGKALAFPAGAHPDGKGSIGARLPDEIADVYAALDYFSEVNLKDASLDIASRRAMKLSKFHLWGLTGVPTPAPDDAPVYGAGSLSSTPPSQPAPDAWRQKEGREG